MDFKITSDEGNFNHWKYSVEYTERLSHWPYWENVAEADFEVKKLHQSDRAQYAVSSDHRTCFLAGLYCCKLHKNALQIKFHISHFNCYASFSVYSTGEFLFSEMGSDTYVVEIVNYQCPPFFGPVCRREVEFQRKAIMQNLAAHFDKNNS